MIKAAFFDIDGTLLSFNTHKVSEGTVRAFERLHAAGVHTFISSGRPMVLIPPMPVSFEAYITMNGGLVFTNDECGMMNDEQAAAPRHSSLITHRSTLISNPIPDADRDAWVDFARQHNLCTMTFTADGMMASQINEVGNALRNQLEFQMPPVVDIEQFRNETSYQIIAIMPAELDSRVGAFMPHCRLPRWHPAFTDIVAAGNSKAVGMEAICRHFGIRREETIAFGDGGNDIEMLQWAGVGIAMGNAEESVKQHADLVTTDVDSEGIENAVNQLLS